MRSGSIYWAWYRKLRKQGYPWWNCLMWARFNSNNYGIDEINDDAPDPEGYWGHHDMEM